jgi:hypothetical protein
MKTRAILAATAIIAGSFNPILTFPAWAAVTIPGGTPAAAGPTQETLDAMQDQCDTLALNHTEGDYTGTLDVGSIQATYVSGPTEVLPAHTIDDAVDGTLVGVGFVPGAITIEGDPFRIGGSVNMFGLQVADGGEFTSSTYDFLHDFDTTYSYAFNCNMTETVFTGATGYYDIAGDFGDSEDAVRNECVAFTNLGDNDPRPKWWGDPYHGGTPSKPHCVFVGTAGEPEPQDRPDEAGTPIQQTQTEELLAHEDAGEGYPVEGDILLGQVVICISPTTTTQTKKGVPGTWTPKNGYDGGSSVQGQPGCNTGYFNIAPWGAGSQTSKGTYISVPSA